MGDSQLVIFSLVLAEAFSVIDGGVGSSGLSGILEKLKPPLGIGGGPGGLPHAGRVGMTRRHPNSKISKA